MNILGDLVAFGVVATAPVIKDVDINGQKVRALSMTIQCEDYSAPHDAGCEIEYVNTCPVRMLERTKRFEIGTRVELTGDWREVDGHRVLFAYPQVFGLPDDQVNWERLLENTDDDAEWEPIVGEDDPELDYPVYAKLKVLPGITRVVMAKAVLDADGNRVWYFGDGTECHPWTDVVEWCPAEGWTDDSYDIDDSEIDHHNGKGPSWLF